MTTKNDNKQIQPIIYACVINCKSALGAHACVISRKLALARAHFRLFVLASADNSSCSAACQALPDNDFNLIFANNLF